MNITILIIIMVIMMMMMMMMMIIIIIIIVMMRTVSNTYAHVASTQSCVNHAQHIERLSRAICSVPFSTKGVLSS